MGALILTTVDYEGEVSIVTFPCPDLTAANITAMIAAGDTLVAAFVAITACVVIKKQYVAKTSPLSAERRSDDVEAEREQKWLNRYYDGTTFERFTLTTPGSKMADKDPARRGFALLSDTQIAAYKSAFEAFVQPGGNAVVLEEMEWVGRNT